MELKFNFVADRVVKGRIYPALTTHEARPYTQAWREFGQRWPYTIPVRLQEYFGDHINIVNSSDHALPETSWYPIGLSFFDFTIDYVDLLGDALLSRVRNRELKILFYYHEGDNPLRIKHRLDQLFERKGLDERHYVFISSNTSADHLSNFITFHDFEQWYWHRNLTSVSQPVIDQSRAQDFTVLNRLHKWWRFTVMSDLDQLGILEYSIWSYCHAPDVHEKKDDCPIEIDLIPSLDQNYNKFASKIPHFSDDISDEDRNNHEITAEHHCLGSYCNIILESQFDVDQSGGAFLTEKTFKPIKYGQLFFVAGGPGSLQALRDLGYRTFDHILDNEYDKETNATRRWLLLRKAIMKAKQQGLREIFSACIDDMQYNQHLFETGKEQRVNTLLRKINAHY